MKVALVGPTHPYKGGVAAHTTQAAHALVAAGHDVSLISWSRLYPALLYPGEQAVPEGDPDLPPFERTIRPLRWDRPRSWWTTGRSLRDVDLVIVVVVVPVQVPALLTLIRALGPRGRRPRVVVIAHNVVPHETHPGGEWLIRRILYAADTTVVHSAEQARLAHALGVTSVHVAPLAPHLPGGVPSPSGRERASRRPPRAPGEPLRILGLGLVRDYKGYDLLLEAAREVPEVTVTIAGEFWGTAGERVRQLAGEAALAGRVELLPGYVPGLEVPALMDRHDVLALPYRHATASQNVVLGHAYGLPVLATTVGTFKDEILDGVNGALVPPADVPALRAALRRLAAPGGLENLRAGLPDLDLFAPWDSYVSALVSTDSGNDVPRGVDVSG